MIKLNLGAGDIALDGYENLDHKSGHEIYPLSHESGTIDEIRASHCLEHFSHHEVAAVVTDWVRVLASGGVLKIAVPNFEWIARNYLDGKPIQVQGYTMGGQVDGDDYHKAIFDAEMLTELMRSVGLTDIRPWVSDVQDCASLPVSLNLMGTKGKPFEMPADWRIGSSMSVPRLGFMDNFYCAFQSLVPLKIGLRKQSGAFWGQCLERSIDEWIKEGSTHILTLHYDTVFNRQHVERLIQLMAEHPEADAIAPIQASRSKSTPLFTVADEDGKNKTKIGREDLSRDVLKAKTAHFGLTLLSVEAIKRMPRPLFQGFPAADGSWNEGRIDDDIHFWQQWEKCGNTLYIAPRVAVGHAELMVRWPDANLEPIYQHPSDFFDAGIPAGAWK